MKVSQGEKGGGERRGKDLSEIFIFHKNFLQGDLVEWRCTHCIMPSGHKKSNRNVAAEK